MHDILIYREKRNLGFPQAAGLIRHAVRAALKAQNVDTGCIVNVMLTDDAGIRTVNLEQRGIDAPTDVLSFPMNELPEGGFDAAACEYDYDTDKCLLGDVVLNLARCREQAESYGHSFDRELSYLTVHSILHLLGYDHMDEGPRKRAMRKREIIIMTELEKTYGIK